jgi:hypothetical protein
MPMVVCPIIGNQQLLDALPGRLHDYYHHRPHRALDGRSPMQLLNNLPGSHTSRRLRLSGS